MKIGSTAADAMNAFSTSVAVTANNLANVNTDGFKASRIDFETGPDGEGVRVSSITEDTSAGPMKEEVVTTEDTETGRVETERELVEGSNTDVATEMVNLMVNENAYGANAEVVRTEDEMAQTVLDMKV